MTLNPFPSRHFNNVWYDEVSGNVIKLSSDMGKLEREYSYYTTLPTELRKYFAEPISYSTHDTYAILQTCIYKYIYIHIHTVPRRVLLVC